MRAVAISTAPDFWFAVEYPLTLALQEAGEETRTHSVRLVRLRILTITKSCLLSRVNGGVPLVSSKPASGLLCVVRKRHGIEHLQRAGRHVGRYARRILHSFFIVFFFFCSHTLFCLPSWQLHALPLAVKNPPSHTPSSLTPLARLARRWKGRLHLPAISSILVAK